MDTQRVILGTLIALLRRAGFPAIEVEKQILEGIKLSRKISVDEAIAKEAGDEPIYEEAILELATITTGATYAEVVKHTVTKRRTAKLEKIEMACENSTDYASVTWKITLGSIVKELILPTALTLSFGGLDIRGGRVIKIEAKTSSGTPDVWADITGKEVI